MDVSLHYERMNGVFEKWHVHGLPFAAVFHRFSEVDDFEPHSHPWAFRSTILAGGYVEEVFTLDGSSERVHRNVGDSFIVEATHIHRIVEFPEGECWTLIQPQGPKVQEPGFWRFENGQAFHRFWHEQDFKLVERQAA